MWASHRAVFSASFVDVGLARDTGVSFFLPRLVDYGRAFEVMCTRTEDRRRRGAGDRGLVNYVVAPDLLLANPLGSDSCSPRSQGTPGLTLKVLLQGWHVANALWIKWRRMPRPTIGAWGTALGIRRIQVAPTSGA